MKNMKAKDVPSEDIWSLDYTVAKFIAPRMRAFADRSEGGPVCFTPKKWKKMLKKMAFAWKQLAKECPYTGRGLSDKKKKKVEEGFKLFWKWFFSLWN